MRRTDSSLTLTNVVAAAAAAWVALAWAAPGPAGAVGRLLVRTGEETVPLETAWVHVAVAIDEVTARTTVTQVFLNHTDAELEGTYVFPLPRDAAVADFAVWHDGRRVAATVEAKGPARDAYDEAAADGREPALLEEHERGLLRMDVFAIPAGGTKRVELVYTERLDYAAGVVGYVFPARFRSETAGEASLFDVDVTVRAPGDLAFVGSPSWPELEVVARAGRAARLALTVDSHTPTRDVDVVFGVETTPIGFAARAYRPKADEPGWFQVGFAFNRDEHPDRRPRREVVFAIDTSLSMAGAPLERARQVVREALAELPESDAVDVVAFDAVVQPLFGRTRAVTARHRAMAETFVGGLRARRGSDLGGLLAALPDLYTPRAPAGGRAAANDDQRVLVLLTDGQPTLGEADDAKLRDALAAREAGLDVMVVHLGYPSRRALLEHLAPGAVYHYLPDGPAGDAAVEDIVHELSAAAFRDVTVRVEGAVTTRDVYHEGPHTVFAGRQLLVHGRYAPAGDGSGRAELVVQGTLHGRRQELRWPIPLPARTDDRHAAIAREWAKDHVRDRLRQIDRAGDDAVRQGLIADVTALGKEHRLVTPYTSFLARRPTSLSLERFKPGDPEIYVEAPPDALRVTAILPWAETIPCRWLPEQGRWMGRFLVPRGTPDGLYRITVVVVLQDGESREYPVFYRVDGTAPRMRLELPAEVAPGQRVRVRAVPLENVFEGRGPTVTLRADVRRAVLRVGGRSVVLRRTADGAAWEGTFVVPQDAHGRLTATLVVSDWAANSFRTAHTLTVAPAGGVR
jgi:Ca-activated chloride channel family protein